jgi:8-oxo-dGTP diphosphatase
MTLEVALAMAEREGRWLLQLRDDIEGIVHPGTWGLFGGHLDPGETPEWALLRELREEINWEAQQLTFWFEHRNPQRVAHFFRTILSVPLEALDLREGQDMVLASLEELRSGSIWSPRRREKRPLAPSLQRAVEVLVGEGSPP